jgi:DNA-binding MarR family transcriptional regulator
LKKNSLDTQFLDSKESLGFSLWKVSNKLQRLHRSGLKEINLTPTQFSLLACIVYMDTSNEVMTQSFLCQHTQMDKMLVSDVIKSLVIKKLVSKKDNPKDSRAVIIAATADGTKLANKAVKIVEDIDTKFFVKVKNKSAFNMDLINLLAD